jgi:protocatechuate 3,4-dioxygenase beta subunit
MEKHFERPITRRGSLVALGGLAAGALGWNVEDARSAGDGPAGVASGAISCVLTPELTEGPYYVSGEKVRSNITEGRPGVPLALTLTAVDASTCRPIRGAAVDIWHCDALGVYSGVQGNTGTFMRGVQRTNAGGLAHFTTVYPGWYSGRAVHIHVKVHIGGNVVHTGQLFFNDALTDAVYTRSPYNTRGARDIRDSSDSIYRNGGSKSLLSVKKNGTGYSGAITMGLHRS